MITKLVGRIYRNFGGKNGTFYKNLFILKRLSKSLLHISCDTGKYFHGTDSAQNVKQCNQTEYN